jgi:IS605 OrfB family transposase
VIQPDTPNQITTTIRLEIPNVTVEVDEQIHAIMRRQQAAKRIAYNRLADGWTEKEIYHHLMDKFSMLTGWDVNAAIKAAKGIREAQSESLKRQGRYLHHKIEKYIKKKSPKPQTINLIREMEEKLTDCQKYIDNQAVPPAIFGGQKLLDDVSRGVPGAKEKWRAARSDEYFSVGDSKNKNGNRHFRLRFMAKYEFSLDVRIPDEKGHGMWVSLPASCSKQYVSRLRSASICGSKFSVRLKRLSEKYYQAFVSIDEPVPGKVFMELKPKNDEFICGIDLNLDHAGGVISDYQGQFRGHNTFQYLNLGEMVKDKTKWYIGNLANQIIIWCKENNITSIVLENLSINQRYYKSQNFNRRTVPFANRQLNMAIQRTALRNGINICLIAPNYTSFIGQIKYAGMY